MNHWLLFTATLCGAGWSAVRCVTTLITWRGRGLWNISGLYHAGWWWVSRLGPHGGIYGLGECRRGSHRRWSSHLLRTHTGSYWRGRGWDENVRTTGIGAWGSASNGILASGGITVSRLRTRVVCRRRSRMWVASQRTYNLIWKRFGRLWCCLYRKKEKRKRLACIFDNNAI